MSKAITVVLMTKQEATETRDKIHNHVGAVAALAKDFYHREGWRALGYKDWKSCAEKEFGHGRARIYQLLDEAKVEEEAPEAAKLSGRATRTLGKSTAPGKRQAALKAAQTEHKTKTPTAPQIENTVAKHKNFAPSGVKPKKTKPIADQAKGDEELQKALGIIGGVCGRKFRDAIEAGTVEMPRADVIKLSEETDEAMIQSEKLITALQWPLAKCMKLLDHMPTEQDRIELLTHLAIASPDDKFDGDFGAFHCVMTVNRKKL